MAVRRIESSGVLARWTACRAPATEKDKVGLFTELTLAGDRRGSDGTTRRLSDWPRQVLRGLAFAFGVAGLSSCVAAPFVAPMLQSALVDVATARFVGDNCPTLGFDTAAAKAQLGSVYNRLVSAGAQPEVIEAQTETFEDAALSDEVAARLEAGGVNPDDPKPANVCAFGTSEKSAGSILGKVLS